METLTHTNTQAMNAAIMYAFNMEENFLAKAFGETLVAIHLEGKLVDIYNTTAKKNTALAFITFHSQLSESNKEILNNYILNHYA